MLWEISEGRRVKPPSEIYWPGYFPPYTLRGISRKCALLLGQCSTLLSKSDNVFTGIHLQHLAPKYYIQYM
jgi:hypothetical protein